MRCLLATALLAACSTALLVEEAPAPEQRCNFKECPTAFVEVESQLLAARRTVPAWVDHAGHALEEFGSKPLVITTCKAEPCTVVKRYPKTELVRAAHRGILFIGDPSARRLYIRLLSRLEEMSEDDSENMQGSVRAPQRNRKIGKLRTSGEPRLHYEKNNVTVAFEVHNSFEPSTLASKASLYPDDEYHTLVVGIPLAHMLHHPAANDALVCQKGAKEGNDVAAVLRDRVHAVVNALRKAAPKQQIILLNGNAYGHDTTPTELMRNNVEKCPYCTNGKCWAWTQTNDGMERANKVVKSALEDVNVAVVDMFQSSIGMKASSVDFNVAYRHPVLDDQLAQLMAVVDSEQ